MSGTSSRYGAPSPQGRGAPRASGAGDRGEAPGCESRQSRTILYEGRRVGSLITRAEPIRLRSLLDVTRYDDVSGWHSSYAAGAFEVTVRAVVLIARSEGCSSFSRQSQHNWRIEREVGALRSAPSCHISAFLIGRPHSSHRMLGLLCPKLIRTGATRPRSASPRFRTSPRVGAAAVRHRRGACLQYTIRTIGHGQRGRAGTIRRARDVACRLASGVVTRYHI
jgi:hypothetical protein